MLFSYKTKGALDGECIEDGKTANNSRVCRLGLVNTGYKPCHRGSPENDPGIPEPVSKCAKSDRRLFERKRAKCTQSAHRPCRVTAHEQPMDISLSAGDF
jgi:hypothetical protein